MTVNKYTRQLEDLALRIAKAAKESKKDYFIGGGLAIDFFYGQITRNHHDIDFHPILEDTVWWIEWFKSRGYKVTNRLDPKFPETWRVYNFEGEAIIDMWPLQQENGVLLINCEGKYVDAGRYWKETKLVDYKKVDIRIENPQRVLEQKTRHASQSQKYRRVDLHDFKLLGKEPK
ncbi:MAG: hypothetical protein UV61_C0001G0022 [Candidatus Gottesmanbacteria bacterium GW2011_GWB1_43_11]|uniref:Aminoglycoside-2''-adenylyltransferase n=1 Tax=Candidatus Gottesmanbacteria bacterium GW2011_GWB1_43_11 TaxID=1618446 RepID=A0A0G1CPJ5_9BACT|nr:MAG: hypothetical protein UV04_C0016G0021 [Candidatus Gottesmanbacteria bacterium GW2011_GWA2_42_16]KKS52454.1 MAG: hypothetical protein UV17_C0045G0014 [Candidatus Gottesmanbacteria bacterium GW2011_GWA1_42_26]KKS81538.1 MAG: hypothetical protein UV55_C0012G0022 [Candidatus Gottesmanbacteria bacterium GW2011_GWC1_43_10]KKS87615.1 MAG: hypothetical protein UV61_C0001G0022 [Candidatus Gottesmanbacteria bacterium GW2011_GWB1_43_11]OGG10079.1 MAG: hypothetical protein A2699_06065 [Candidatus Go